MPQHRVDSDEQSCLAASLLDAWLRSINEIGGALTKKSIGAIRAASRRYTSMLPELRKRSEARIAASPDFQYVRDQLALLKQSRAQKTVSLNEETRRQERDQMRQKSLDIENKRRKARGEPG